MHLAIDILAAIVLLFFFLAGWHKGFLLSLLGVVRVILAYSAAFYAGRYIGFWLGEVLNRPKIVMMPVIAGLAFTLVTFSFHLLVSKIREKRSEREEEGHEERSFISSLGGSAVNLGAGLLSLILLFWLGDVFIVGMAGTGIPGADDSRFGRLARATVFETARFVIPDRDNASQINAIAHMISNPADAMTLIEEVISAESIQMLVKDEQLPGDLMSGDPERIRMNPAIQQLFSDRETLENLKDLGVFSGAEKKSVLCEKLASFGRNDTIRLSVESLNERDMFRTDRIPLLIRDPYFDAIIAELLR